MACLVLGEVVVELKVAESKPFLLIDTQRLWWLSTYHFPKFEEKKSMDRKHDVGFKDDFLCGC